MKTLGITLISNNPKNFEGAWLATIKHLDPLRDHVSVSFGFHLQSPWAETNHCQRMGQTSYSRVEKEEPCFNWVRARERSLANVPDVDYWLMTDDDMNFSPGTKSGYTSWRRYLDAIQYMDNNPGCGAVCLKHFLGGKPSGRLMVNAMINPIYATAAGLILRNIGKMDGCYYADPVFNRPGALDETAAIFSRIERGYFVAKTFNCPTYYKNKTKAVSPDTEHLAYNSEFINSEGIGSVVRKRYDDPNWDYSKRYLPTKLREYHERNRRQ